MKKPNIEMLNIGDVVNWTSDASIFERAKESYNNPGIIIDILPGRGSYGLSSYEVKKRAVVCWSDGKVTTEHEGFLEVIVCKK